MAGKFLWFALFVTLQVSFVLCRSTGKPNENDKEFITSLNSEAPKAEALSGTVAPGTKLHGDYIDFDGNRITIDNDEDFRNYRDQMTAAVIVYAIVLPVFIFLSLILGCIMMCCCKKEPRRGYVVGSAAGQAPSSVQPMQQYPPPYGQKY